ncbi:hypothetical protein PFICI_06870 [Pestalotiopsis fici W106-1]|uniref:Cytochrome P450 n=1 Tax=Pestalotiopsis fici (strain W106-1 / CGMCC3.15140) TaxID=1229662 RepID=W3X6X8_PESFW|nr:uncharacterized protein PFICI_06870 [Pestalotiopsis fici W106-1]ETS81868.1 hypothetical protein PFICI_06870 [Pestalotiopsis fici W106-1]
MDALLTQELSHFIIGTLVGKLIHLNVFIRREWHKSAPTIFILHASSAMILLIARCLVADDEAMKMVTGTTMVFLGYITGLMTNMTLYRVYFHPLANHGFKGPRYAGMTKLWHSWAARDGQNHLLLESLRHQYGDFVRTGPAELTVFHPAALAAINGPKSTCIKGEWYDIFYPNMQSIVTCRDKADHAAHRREWNRAFLPDALAHYGDVFSNNLEALEVYLDSCAKDNQPCEMRDLLLWFSFDVMGELVFSTSFGMVRNKTWHPIVRHVKEGLHLIGLLSAVPWLTQIGFRLAPPVSIIRNWHGLVDYCKNIIHQRIEKNTNGQAGHDFMHYMLLQQERFGDNGGPSWLVGDTLMMLVAGRQVRYSRPSLIPHLFGTSMLFILYNLVNHPHHAELIYHEIEGIDIDDNKALSQLSHLNAVINESSRLGPSIPTGGNRKTGPMGLMIGQTYIPPETTIVAPRYSIFRREDCFEKADQFIPERWTTRPEMVRDSTAFKPFGMGDTSCLGRTLSLRILRRVIAQLVKKYEFRFAPGEIGCHVYGDLADHFSATPGQLHLCVKIREQQ